VEDLLAPWDCGVDSVIERRAIYRFHGLVARQWRKGRIFLAGDSAHQMPPFAGQGMCAGVRDASNLAWKLAAVLQGGASETLLDSYQMERDPQVREVIDLAIHMGRVVCTLDPKAAAERDASMFAAQNAGLDPPRPVFKPFAHGFLLEDTPAAGELFPQPTANGVKLDDVLGPDAWLISRAMSPGFRTPTRGLSFFSLKDECLSPFAATLQQWLDQRNVSAVLVRPDRYVFGTGLASLLKLAYNNALTAGNTSPVSE
jgi:3-(3-hydroxy-phenyl)propionate hydroxylase